MSKLDKITESGNYDCIHFPGGYFYSEDDKQKQYYDKTLEYAYGWDYFSKHGMEQRLLVLGSVYAQCYKQSVIKENNLFFNEELSYGEDRLFVIEFFYYAKRLFVYDKPLYCYNIRENSLMTSKNNDMKKTIDSINSMEYLWSFLRTKKVKKQGAYLYINGVYISSIARAIDKKNRIKLNYHLLFSTSVTLKRFIKTCLFLVRMRINMAIK